MMLFAFAGQFLPPAIVNVNRVLPVFVSDSLISVMNTASSDGFFGGCLFGGSSDSVTGGAASADGSTTADAARAARDGGTTSPPSDSSSSAVYWPASSCGKAFLSAKASAHFPSMVHGI